MWECYSGREKLKVWWHRATLWHLLFFLTFIHTVHSYFHSPFAQALLVSSSLLAQQEEPLWGAEPRFEVGPALQATASRRANIWATPRKISPSIFFLSGVIFSASKTNWIRIRISRRSTPSLHHFKHVPTCHVQFPCSWIRIRIPSKDQNPQHRIKTMRKGILGNLIFSLDLNIYAVYFINDHTVIIYLFKRSSWLCLRSPEFSLPIGRCIVTPTEGGGGGVWEASSGHTTIP